MDYLDKETLDELLGMLGDDLHPIVDEFITQLSEQLQALASAASSQDWPVVAQLSHTIKGSAGNMGAVALSQVATDLEQAAAANAAGANVPVLVASLEQTAHASIAAYAVAGFGSAAA